MIGKFSEVPRVRMGPTDAFLCIQLSPPWWELRQGMPTSSSFDRIMTPAKRKFSESADGYISELIAERFCLDPNAMTDRQSNPAMRHGVNCEAEARAWYEMHTNKTVQQIGVAVSSCGKFMASPDGLVADDGDLELKCPQGKTHVAYLRKGVLPLEYMCQCHGHLIVTGRDWCDFVSYCSGLDPLVVRVVPNDFTATLRDALRQFDEMFQDALEKIGSRP